VTDPAQRTVCFQHQAGAVHGEPSGRFHVVGLGSPGYTPSVPKLWDQYLPRASRLSLLHSLTVPEVNPEAQAGLSWQELPGPVATNIVQYLTRRSKTAPGGPYGEAVY